MEILGYIASLLIGVSLGLIGAGGSILTVPVMVYFFHVPVLAAISYSLFIVGFTSLIGTCYQFKQKNVNMKVAGTFGLVSLAVVFLIRRYLLPLIPAQLLVVTGRPVTFSQVSLLLFSILMVMAATAMIRQKHSEEPKSQSSQAIGPLLFYGALVGVVTGFLGAGGGFILIPSLVLFLGLTIKKAIGTSLLIIALNSLFGFVLDLDHAMIDWQLLGMVTLIAASGIFLGLTFGGKVSARQLKKVFGWMVLITGVVILSIELIALITERTISHSGRLKTKLIYNETGANVYRLPCTGRLFHRK